MKRVLSLALCACLLLLCACSLSSCGEEEKRREDGGLYLEGTYIHEDGNGENVYVFTKDLLVLFRVVDLETVEFHFDYVIEEKAERKELTITYKGVVYGGSDPEVSTYVTNMRINFAKKTSQTDPIEIGEDYIVISGKKLLLQ